MINYNQMQDIVTEILKDMQAFKPQARDAIMMIIAHESNCGKYWRQIGGGPALGIIQMEPWVHDDTWEHCDSINERAGLLSIKKNIKQLERSIEYNVFMARCRLLMDVKPLPNDLPGMSAYLKKYWNSDSGKAEHDSYLKAYRYWRAQ